MAQRYPHQDSAQALYWPAFGPAFFDKWDANDWKDERLLCAEMSRLAYADQPTVKKTLGQHGFALTHWIGGETREQRGATNGTDGFIASRIDPPLTVLAFRGTESNKPEDLLTDALATSEVWDPKNPGHGKVHRGFKQVYALIAEDVRGKLAQFGGRLLVTGHSLGAGLATVAAADLAGRPRAAGATFALITFGSPRVGDKAFKQALAGVDLQRFVDCCDMVARIPPEKFERREIRTLLEELIPARLHSGPFAKSLIETVAAALAAVLAALNIQPEYDHVCDATYGNQLGTTLPSPTTGAIETDQRTAREAYKGGLTPDIKHLLHELVSAVSAATAAEDSNAIREAIRNFGARLFQGDPVPLRDLADHAPINYVTLFTGR